MKTHTTKGARLLSEVGDCADNNDFVDMAIEIAKYHHENWNGTGYPNNLSGENIPIESQIILIVDSYCAWLEDRPYRPAKSRDEALEIIMDDSNSKWSARLASEFASVMKEDLV